jgi:hypothetical protein
MNFNTLVYKVSQASRQLPMMPLYFLVGMGTWAFREPRHPPTFERIVVSHLQDPSLPATLGSGPVGFTLSGVPIYGPFDEAGTKVGILGTTTLPTCPFFSVSDEWGKGWWGRLHRSLCGH